MTSPAPAAPPTLGVVVADAERDADLRALAERAGLPLLTAADTAPACLLLRDDIGLLLRARLRNGTSDVRVSMHAPRVAVQRRSSLLARAVGGDRGELVIDATCGLGRDAHELVLLGYRVRAFERHPVLALLVRDALLRLRVPIELHETDAASALASMPAHSVHAVCLDPMFPPRVKRAGVKKAAEVLQLVVGPEVDSSAVFAAAWHAGRRVVVKRPHHAPALADGPNFVVRGRALRFDVYLTLGRTEPAVRPATAPAP